MTRKKEEPAITYTEILSLAAEQIREEILKIRKQADEMEAKANTPELRALVADLMRNVRAQEDVQKRKLLALETMYRIQTGSELGIAGDLGYEEE